MSDQQPPSKGSVEAALAFWRDQAPALEDSVHSLLVDIFNFQAAGVNAPMVQRSVILNDGRVLRIYGRLI